MGMEGDAADLLMKECIHIAEATAQMLGKGLIGTVKTGKNVAAFFYALSHSPDKLKGKTSMQKFIRSCGGSAATAVPIAEKDVKEFTALAKSYAIPCTPVKLKGRTDGVADMLIRAQDASSVNRILERLGYPAVGKEQETKTPKKSESRDPQGPSSERRGSGLTSSEETRTMDTTSDRPSIRGRLAYFAAQEQETHKAPQGPEIPIKNKRGGHSHVD